MFNDLAKTSGVSPPAILVLILALAVGCADAVQPTEPTDTFVCPTPELVLDHACNDNANCVELTSHPEVSYEYSVWNDAACGQCDWSTATIIEGYALTIASEGPTPADCTYVYEGYEQCLIGSSICERVVNVLFKHQGGGQ
jgi:hypothetical protein